mmetsp:Transcript_18033/g.46508  ORF Transcript_18033/g.46508 Transcript_18033/m.46508 type:complete len:526 (+) Transcript_18033:35-1612(+)
MTAQLQPTTLEGAREPYSITRWRPGWPTTRANLCTSLGKQPLADESAHIGHGSTRKNWRPMATMTAPRPGSLDRDAGAVLGRVLVDALQDACADRARAALVSSPEVARDHVRHLLLPEDRAGHLLREGGADGLRVLVRLAVNVGDHRDARLLDLHRLEHLLELLHRRRHEVGVERASHRQRHRHARFEFGLGDLDELRASLLVAGHGVVALAQVVRNLHGLARVGGRLLAQLGALLGVETNNGDHGGLHRVGRRLHCLAARLRDLHAVLEAQRPGEAEGAVLAEGEAHGHGGLLDRGVALLLAQLLDGRHRGREDRRLRDGRGVKLFLRPVHAEVQQVVAENLARLVEELLGLGNLLHDLLAHAHGLRALAGEEEGLAVRRWRRGGRRDLLLLRRILAQEQRAQPSVTSHGHLASAALARGSRGRHRRGDADDAHDARRLEAPALAGRRGRLRAQHRRRQPGRRDMPSSHRERPGGAGSRRRRSCEGAGSGTLAHTAIGGDTYCCHGEWKSDSKGQGINAHKWCP